MVSCLPAVRTRNRLFSLRLKTKGTGSRTDPVLATTAYLAGGSGGVVFDLRVKPLRRLLRGTYPSVA